MKGFVYILKDETDMYYIGSTDDVSRRFKAHLNGNTRTTSRMINPALVFAQEYETLQYARRVERRLKNLKRKDYLEKVIKDGFIKLKL